MARRTNADDLLSSAVERGEVAGVVAMATDGRDVIYEGAFGTRQLGDATAMRKDTVFWIASMTKAITGACLMQLVEQGRIGLDDDVGRWVQALAKPRVLTSFDANGKPSLRIAEKAITLRRLLTHTAGFVYDMWNADQLRYMAATKVSRTASFAKPEDCLPLAFEPGERWEYGINIDWAGKVLESITGQSLDAYMQQHVLQPLGMRDTGYLLRPEISARLAGMHQRQADGRLIASDYKPSQDPAGFTGGGGLYGTAGDYMRFIMMMLNGGALDGVRILKAETVALMGQNHIGDLSVNVMPTQRPALSCNAEFFPGMRKTWGLSFMINTDHVAGGRSAGSLSWAGLLNTYYWIDPIQRIGGTVMTQLLPFADPAVLRLYAGFEREVYALAGG